MSSNDIIHKHEFKKIPWWSKLAEWDGPLYKDGYLTIPDKPGLGASLNEAVCKAHLAPGTKFF